MTRLAWWSMKATDGDVPRTPWEVKRPSAEERVQKDDW
jgi:hypothetical protein